MAIIHVSAQRGNDAYTKAQVADQATPWATITKAVANVAAGDTVYIGPGTYREKITLVTSGTVASPINWIPDPDCSYLTGDNSGIVRITGCDTDEKSTTGQVWNFSNRNYNTIGDENAGFAQCWIDGSSDSYSVAGFVTTTLKGYGIVASSKYGLQYCGHFKHCLLQCSESGIFPGTGLVVENCISIGGKYGFYNLTSDAKFINCVSIGAQYNYNNTNAINCTAIGGQNGFLGGHTLNGLAIGCVQGFSGNADNSFKKCRAVRCAYSAYGTSNTLLMNTSSIEGAMCSAQRGLAYETDIVGEAKLSLYDFLGLIDILEPFFEPNAQGMGVQGLIKMAGVTAGDIVTINGIVFTAHATTTTPANREFSIAGTDVQDATELVICINDATYGVPGVTAENDGGTTSAISLLATAAPLSFTLSSSNFTRLVTLASPVSGYDMIGHNRLFGSLIDIGAITQSKYSTDFINHRNIAPAIKLERAGQKKFVFFADKNVAFTRSVWVKWSNVAADKKPQLIAKGRHITTQTATAVGDGSTWEQISVTATPAADGEIELFLYARDTAETAVVYFSDLG